MKSLRLQRRALPLALSAVLAISFAAAQRAQSQRAQSQPPVKEVVLRFPNDRSMGKLFRLKIVSFDNPECTLYGQARGQVKLPANTKLMLQLSYDGLADLAPLANCVDQDVIYSIDARHVENLTDQSLQEIAKLKSVKQLLLKDGDITDTGAQYIATMPQLLHLDLSKTMVTAKGLSRLRTLTALKTLDLDMLSLKGTDLACLPPMVHLENLSVPRSGLANNAMKNIGKVTSLIRLKVSKNSDITDEGVSMLANLKNLQGLNLANTGITIKCVPSLQKLRHLTSLVISLPPQELAQIKVSLRKTNPNCHVQGVLESHGKNIDDEVFGLK